MNFLKNIFSFSKKDTGENPSSRIDESTKLEPGIFTTEDLPIDDKNVKCYFYEYERPDGDWIDIGQPICKIRIGEKGVLQFSAVIIKAEISGVLEWTCKMDEPLSNGQVYFRLHQKGEYQNENLPENPEFKEYFNAVGQKYNFDKWLLDDGEYVRTGQPIFNYNDLSYNSKTNHSKKAGYIHQMEPKKFGSLDHNEMIYIVRDNDKKRINERFLNKPAIIRDDFTNSTIIKWKSVSSKYEINTGVKTVSDDSTIDFLFSFNYINGSDHIVFLFDPKQIKPKQFDKIIFLFENKEKIQFELRDNPVNVIIPREQKRLECKALITQSELDSFANFNFLKWKISLGGNFFEILGGEKGADDFYTSKNNLQIVIKKFARDYINLVQKVIPDYKPMEFRQAVQEEESRTDFCFVYLMHDTNNNYYKIGISNSPQYREKTLQSEKPTIEMITAKKFPIRKIAESIERALHSSYSEKRLRGEWFELNENDVEHIKETLK